ncbi:helix-turn-helix transcriptional regulator [Schumannella luteola]|uniref:HTH-type transcriptional regulator RipA n=1 Tax=Schumannella luteola TaxID=472059 RepID=A0A852Y7C8_9MICO|nr:AraC family transcriptional regulator [Schumannella luteola]NYG98866.1 AraC-like DNA-binding protein/mannose-6-phosphate isomerase-like protein (cupin superfamily) [Schumannella luteola]TPX01957.1 AraC family transcriptional regulator [Schumannella luteola]
MTRARTRAERRAPASSTTDGARGSWAREPGTEVRAFTAATADPPGGDATPRVIRTGSEVADVPLEWVPHAHSMHELVWVRGGTMTSRVGDRVFTIAEGRGLWMPAGVEHAGRLTAGGELFDAFFEVDATPDDVASRLGDDRTRDEIQGDATPGVGNPRERSIASGATEIEMTPVLESLLLYLARPDLDAAARARAEAVVFDVIEPAAHPLALAVPQDARIAPIVTALLDDPADPRGLEDWAAQLDASERTITRAFRGATGLSFAQWRQTRRVHHALLLLAEGGDVRSVSDELGYAQASTFIAAFRRVIGVTPGAFAARQ